MQKAHLFIFALVVGVLAVVFAAGPAPASAEEGAKKPAACAAEKAGSCKMAGGEHAKSGCCSDGAACCTEGAACCSDSKAACGAATAVKATHTTASSSASCCSDGAACCEDGGGACCASHAG